LKNQEAGEGGEIQLTDAIRKLNQSEAVYSYHFEGTCYDVGDKIGFIKTTNEFAMQREGLRCELLDYIDNILRKHKYRLKL